MSVIDLRAGICMGGAAHLAPHRLNPRGRCSRIARTLAAWRSREAWV